MHKLARSVISIVARRFRSRAVVELENLALRHQLHVLRLQRPGRLRLFTFDRLLWVLLYRLWPGCLEAMVSVKPATVIQWHRQGFRLFWRWRSRSGRPSVDREVRDLTARAHRRGLGRTDRTSSPLDRARTSRGNRVVRLRSITSAHDGKDESSGIERVALPPRMEPPHLLTETLAASCPQTARKWFSPVPPNLQMTPQSRAIWLIRAENPQTRGLAGGEGWIRTPETLQDSRGGIQPEFGALFGPNKSIHAGENLFALDSALLRSSPVPFVH